MSYYLNG